MGFRNDNGSSGPTVNKFLCTNPSNHAPTFLFFKVVVKPFGHKPSSRTGKTYKSHSLTLPFTVFMFYFSFTGLNDRQVTTLTFYDKKLNINEGDG